MKTSLVLFIFYFGCLLTLNGQSFYSRKIEKPWSLSLHVGPTQYFGDLYSFWEYNDGIQPKWNLGLAYHKILDKNFKLRLNTSFIKLAGQDRLSDPKETRINRNLHFRSNIFEVSGMIEYYLKDLWTKRSRRPVWNPYIYLGLGLATNNPKTELDGEWIALRPLAIEQNPYSSIITVVPFGIGFKYKLTPLLDLTVEGTYRFTFSDYMDDISVYDVSEFYLQYVNDYLSGENTEKLRLAIRNPDYLDEFGYPDVDKILSSRGDIRRGSGKDGRNDGYMTINVGLEFQWYNGLLRRKYPNLKRRPCCGK